MDIEDSKKAGQKILEERKFDSAEKAIRYARIVLFILATLVAIVSLYRYYSILEDLYGLIGGLVEAAIYLALAFWTYRRPFVATLIGLLIYLAGIIFLATIDSTSLYKGLLIKILVIIALVNALAKTKDLRKKRVKKDDLLDENMIDK